jgi:hypothetical protein
MNVPGPVVSAFPKRARWWTTHDLYYDNNGRKKQQRNIGIIGSKKDTPQYQDGIHKVDWMEPDWMIRYHHFEIGARHSFFLRCCARARTYLGTPEHPFRLNYPRSGNLTVKRLKCGPATVT